MRSAAEAYSKKSEEIQKAAESGDLLLVLFTTTTASAPMLAPPHHPAKASPCNVRDPHRGPNKARPRRTSGVWRS